MPETSELQNLLKARRRLQARIDLLDRRITKFLSDTSNPAAALAQDPAILRTPTHHPAEPPCPITFIDSP
ncbi:MAG: hypothetical protein ACTHN5_12970 [Phycisphaerae bacterium]